MQGPSRCNKFLHIDIGLSRFTTLVWEPLIGDLMCVFWIIWKWACSSGMAPKPWLTPIHLSLQFIYVLIENGTLNSPISCCQVESGARSLCGPRLSASWWYSMTPTSQMELKSLSVWSVSTHSKIFCSSRTAFHSTAVWTSTTTTSSTSTPSSKWGQVNNQKHLNNIKIYRACIAKKLLIGVA